MLILALDTTTPAGSVALADGARTIEVAAIDRSVPVASRLPGELAALLARHACALDRVDVLAVATGPGSFTGLRIGIATMQGLAVATGTPLVGVSTFEALATLADAPRVAVWIDAWRGEVYAAVFEGVRPAGEPVVVPAGAAPREATMIGDGAVRYKDLLASSRIVEPTPLAAGAVAARALVRAANGERPPPHAIRPLYVRRPDAELARERR